ncbi:type II toxin-antitoxin system VapB family antitoxin [Lapillicoccus sp.]|uniref:type II toxin-antitoxin system VapB family antitoxin n=1 Tax=Lapillicoccus sp. TaxID=1909287 RepID=UPI00398363CF
MGRDVKCGTFVRCTRRPADEGVSRNARHGYLRCMSTVRTNIEIEDVHVQVIMGRFSVRTRTEAVALALRHLAGQPMTREEALQMRGARAIGAVPPDRSPHGPA